MINIEALTDEHKGRSVIYTDGKGDIDEGHITSWNKRFVFVDYGRSCGRGIATSPQDLTWTIGKNE